MSARDYSDTLFYKVDESPAFLPNRMRLPSHMTRYSYAISLEEVKSLGYLGPVTYPEFNHETHKVSWDSSSATYLVVAKTAEEIAADKDLEVRNILKAEVVNVSSFTNEDIYAAQFVSMYTAYISSINTLLDSSNLLTLSDIPDLGSIPVLQTKVALQAAQKEVSDSDAVVAEDNTYDWKYQYEHMGVRAWELPNYEDLQPFLYEIPVNWTASGTAS